MYGGGDPNVRYNRDLYPETSQIEVQCGTKFPFSPIAYYSMSITLSNLVIANRVFTLFKTIDNPIWRVYDYHSKEIQDLLECVPRYARKFYRDLPTLQEGNDATIALTRVVGNPVVHVLNWKSFPKSRSIKVVDFVNEYVPLHKFGLPKYYLPNQIYQDLAYYLGNTIKPSPDVQPPGNPKQTDKEKILSHGMDLKQSFRHRKDA